MTKGHSRWNNDPQFMKADTNSQDSRTKKIGEWTGFGLFHLRGRY
jgi:hypothetical protein